MVAPETHPAPEKHTESLTGATTSLSYLRTLFETVNADDATYGASDSAIRDAKG